MAEKVNMFGSNHDVLGSSDSNLILRTKGKVKILWGNKFIDLLDDGKIAGSESKFIYHTDKVGTKDGIYVIGEGDDTKVVLVVGDLQITLLGEIGTTYVSFMGLLDTTSEQKEQALKNIGFLYDSLDDVDSDAVLNGIIFVDGKLYVITQGAISEYLLDIPNPYTKLFVVTKSDSSTGAIVINGDGILNSLAFNGFYLFSDDSNANIQATNNIQFNINNIKKVSIEPTVMTATTPISADTFLSVSANSLLGFRLYMANGESTLEVDNLTVRKSADIFNNNTDYPTQWISKYNNIIDYAEYIEQEEEQEEDDPNDEQPASYNIWLKYPSSLTTNGCGYVYVSADTISSDEGTSSSLICVPLIATEDAEGNLSVKPDKDHMDSDDYDIISSIGLADYLNGAYFFIISPDGTYNNIVRISNSAIDSLSVSSIEEELTLEGVKARIGDLTELGLTYDDNGNVVTLEGSGIYASLGIFGQAMLMSGNDIPSDDRSSRLATTQWVMDRINEAISK